MARRHPAAHQREAREDERDVGIHPKAARALGIADTELPPALDHDCLDFDFGGCPCVKRAS